MTFQRPEKHNALNTETMLDLQRAFAELQLDRSIDAAVLQGAGEKAFSAGADIEQYAGTTEKAHRIGLVNNVVAPGELGDAVDDVVSAIQDTGTEAVKNSKRAINAAADSPSLTAAREREAELWWKQFATDERRRLVDEFVGYGDE